MGVFPTLFKVTRKGKCLLLLVLCLCVLAWIAAFSSNDVVRESPFKDLNVIEESPRRELESEMIPSMEEQTPKESCPDRSPLLREYFPHFILVKCYTCSSGKGLSVF